LCTLYLYKREYDKAIAEGERAVALEPGGTAALVNYAAVLRAVGRPEDAIPLYQRAIQLNPLGPSFLYREFGDTLRITGRSEEAVSAYKKAFQLPPDNIMVHIGLTAIYSMMGREKEAHAEAAEVLRINPKFSADSFAKILE
jgi:adenylate cyclase